MTYPASRGHMWSFDNIQALLADFGPFQAVKPTGFMARCPAHGDRTASLHVDWVPDAHRGGKILMHCHGCKQPAREYLAALDPALTEDVLFDEPLPKPDPAVGWQSRVGRSPQQRLAGKRRTSGKLPQALVKPAKAEQLTHAWQEVVRYPYTDPDTGRLVEEVIREECHACTAADGTVTHERHKQFRQIYWLPNGRSVRRKPSDFVPFLYRQAELRDAIAAGIPVWLLEGEKDVENAVAAGDVAGTNVQGGLAFPAERAEVFHGATVYVVIDRDHTGYSRGLQLHKLFGDLGDCSVVLLLPATTEPKSDYTDHLDAGLRDPRHPYNGFIPVTVGELRAHEIVATLRTALDGGRADTVCRARLEAQARAALADDPETSDPGAELQRAKAWAEEAERRFEVLADQLEQVRRLAKQAATPWAQEAAEQAADIWSDAKALARTAHEDARIPIPQPLLDDEEIAQAAAGAADPVGDDQGDERAAEQTGGPGAVIAAPRYRILGGQLVEVTYKDGAERARQVLSIDARIVEMEYLEADATVDVSQPKLFGREHLDGFAEANPAPPETLSAVVIGYHHPDTGEWMRMRIPADDFKKDSVWLESLPGPPEYESSTRALAKLRDALKSAAAGNIKRTVRFRSTGWRRDESGEWFYVHAGGAITAAGPRVAPVLLSGPMGRYNLPAPANDVRLLRQAFLDHSGAMLTQLPARVTAPLLGHVFRSAMGPSPWVLLMVGSPGSFKTSVASLGMHHWGELWDRRHPGSSMSGNGDTLNALRIKLHSAKDALYWADDVAPTRDWAAAQKLLEEFARLVHNGEQRSRSTRDGQGVLDGTPPRASAIVTSEVAPRPGTSGGARTFPVPMQAAEIDVRTLIGFDGDESRYGRALVMSTFLQWLAGNLDKARAIAKEESERFAKQLRDGGGAVRSSEAAGEIWAGWVVLSRFLVEVQALTDAEAGALLDVAMLGMNEAITASTDPDLPATTGARVRELIAHALRTGIAYVDDVRTGTCPQGAVAARLGWRRVPTGDSDSMSQKTRDESRGIRLGYVLLDPTPRDGGETQLLVWQTALEQVIKEAAGRMTDAPQVDLATARQALADDGTLIVERRAGLTPRYTVQRTLHCEGRRQRMIALRLQQIIGADPDPGDDQLGFDDADPDPRPDNPLGSLDGLTLRELLGIDCQGGDVASELTEPEPEDGQETAVPDDIQEPDMAVSRAACEGQYALSLDTEPADDSAAPTSPSGAQPETASVPEPDPVPDNDISAETTPAPPQPEPASATPAPEPAPAAPLAPVPAGEFRASVAVLDVEGLWLPDGTRLAVPDSLAHVGHIAELAESLQLGHRFNSGWVEPAQIWVTTAMLARLGVNPPAPNPDSRTLREQLGQASAGEAVVTGALADGWQLSKPGDRLGPWTKVWRGTGRAVFVVFLAGLPQTAQAAKGIPVLDDNPTPVQLARRMALYADRVGMPFRVSAQATGFDLMWQTRRDRDRVFAPTEPVGPEHFPKCEADIEWSRVPTEAERAHRYVHAYDRGGSHLGGFAGLELGIGEATHYEEGTAFDAKLPGYWRVDVPSAADWRYPHPLLPDGGKPGLLWLTTPSLVLARELGYELEPTEAYVWHEHARVLEGWYERMRDARTALDVDDVDAQLVRDLVKTTYTRTIGQMGSELHMRTKVADGDGSLIDGWRSGFAPHRRHHAIAKARANILRFVLKTGTTTDRWPVAITNDTLLYVSDDPDPEAAFPGSRGDGKRQRDTWGRGIGQYKWEGSALLDEHAEFLTGKAYLGKEKLTKEWDHAGGQR